VSLLFNPFCPVLLVARGLSDDPRGECGWSYPRRRSAGRARTEFFEVQYWWFGRLFRTVRSEPETVRQAPTDSLPGPCGRSAPDTADWLSPFLLERCFRVALRLALFLGLVGPL
jgi:hypothetical protein